jgi:amicyanin
MTMTMARKPAQRLMVVVALAALAPFVASAQVAQIEVTIDNFKFNPMQLTVKAGDTVKWVNRDDIPHTVASQTMPFRSKAMDTNDTVSFTFTKPGTYAYFCSLHPMMTGSIVVEAGASN